MLKSGVWVATGSVQPRVCPILQYLDVARLWAALTARNDKTDGETVFEASAATISQSSKMHENLVTAVTNDKAKALGGVEPLNCAILSRPFSLFVGRYCLRGRRSAR